MNAFDEVLTNLNNRILFDRILFDLTLLRTSLDRLWKATQTLPPSPARTQIELTHQSMVAILLDLDTPASPGIHSRSDNPPSP
jgi:hypothetical protein